MILVGVGSKTYVDYPFFRYGKVYDYRIGIRLVKKKRKKK
jgi:hypothetical protein